MYNYLLVLTIGCVRGCMLAVFPTYLIDKLSISQHGSNGPMWKGIDRPFGCVITSPKKETKFRGIKTFIAYQVTPSVCSFFKSSRVISIN